uniref:Uncharacterized protein n=1 Tax=Utricularia reniformis TaxID=192314 RepID=A0A1Y0B4M5_9LAMI|nr:hypothetical protein AEK19_MT2196 [Utricularia reniformis]ART32343.1 hypothetical protein AEK19_MT2196 [Utricularia reniformis]
MVPANPSKITKSQHHLLLSAEWEKKEIRADSRHLLRILDITTIDSIHLHLRHKQPCILKAISSILSRSGLRSSNLSFQVGKIGFFSFISLISYSTTLDKSI